MPDGSRTSTPLQRQTQTLWSFGGTRQVTEVYIPRDSDELRRVLQQASSAGRKLSFRSGGRSGMAGFAVSIAFEKIVSARFPEEERALRDLAQLCYEKYCGRVHLVKHVYAADELLATMYPELQTFLGHKQTLDAQCLLQNEFLRRVFPVAVTRPARG